eukprot:12415289-Karenia_brevis.AAC.1
MRLQRLADVASAGDFACSQQLRRENRPWNVMTLARRLCPITGPFWREKYSILRKFQSLGVLQAIGSSFT